MRISFGALVAALACFLILVSCSRQSDEELVKTTCSSCHQFTPPQLLDKTTWEKSILPEMAFRMGLPSPVMAKKNFDELGDAIPTLPARPMVTEKEFQRITEYFIKNSPDSLDTPKRDPTSVLTQFEVKKVVMSESLPFVCMVKQDSAGRAFVAGRNRSLTLLSRDFSELGKFILHSPVSSVMANGENLLCLEMGIMDPNDKPFGKVAELNLKTKNLTIVIDSLKRPVYFDKADFNGDNRQDLIICEFGNYSGRLEIFEKLSDGKYKPHLIEASPGSRKVIIQDFNHDGKPDVLALLAQGNERVNLYVNEGNFKFNVSTVLSFPAVYGISYFEIHDFNKDGFFDILCTNGDNSDYSPILKPYHGVRIYLNDGKNNFKEKWFYPINGASWVEARDFDEDGDLDFAAITFFPDYKTNPGESFIYFENKEMQFTPYTIAGPPSGRWLVMETGDVDGDKDIDIILGALDFKPGDEKLFQQWKKEPVALLVLKNKLRK